MKPAPFVLNLECPNCGRRGLVAVTATSDRPPRYRLHDLPRGFAMADPDAEPAEHPRVKHTCGAAFDIHFPRMTG